MRHTAPASPTADLAAALQENGSLKLSQRRQWNCNASPCCCAWSLHSSIPGESRTSSIYIYTGSGKEVLLRYLNWITHLFATGNASIVELRNVDAMSSILFLMRAHEPGMSHISCLNCKEKWIPSVSQASQEPLLSKRARKTCQDNALHDPASAQPNPSLGSCSEQARKSTLLV